MKKRKYIHSIFKHTVIALFVIGNVTTSALAEPISPQTLPAISGDQLQLGKVDFPTSTTSSLAQAHFLLGLKYLHNFMYPLALEEFTLAKQADPSFAMSYWGIAMSHNWPIWNFKATEPAQKTLKDFHALKNVALSPLEKSLLNAVDVLYSSGSVAENNKKYLEAMKKVYQQFPDNPDVASFYSLALISYAFEIDNEETNSLLQEARNILNEAVKTYPGHPGVIHYIMHVNDVEDKHFVKEGTAVTDNIFEYIKESSHVLHMPSHLYARLGMWPEAIHANILSVDGSNNMCRFLETKEKQGKWSPAKRAACDADNKYHSLEWLHHEYLEMGEYEKASQLLQQMEQVAKLENHPMYNSWAYRMKTQQLTFTSLHTPLQSLPKPIKREESHLFYSAASECNLLLANMLQAVYNNQTDFFPKINQRYQEILLMLNQQIKKTQTGESFETGCKLDQTIGWAAKTAYIDKKPEEALRLLKKNLPIYQQEAVAKSFASGMPLHEMYAEILLQNPTQANIQKAIDLYQDELHYYPNHRPAVAGLKHAQKLLSELKKPVQ